MTNLELLESLTFKHGAHKPNTNSEMCVMEAVAYIAGEDWSDHPKCVSPVIATFMRSWNDGLPTDEDRTRLLKPLIPVIMNTSTNKKDELTRSWMAFDWLVRVQAPAFLDLTESLKPHADALRVLPEIDSKERLTQAKGIWAAAGDAARAAAGDAAWDAAGDAQSDIIRRYFPECPPIKPSLLRKDRPCLGS